MARRERCPPMKPALHRTFCGPYSTHCKGDVDRCAAVGTSLGDVDPLMSDVPLVRWATQQFGATPSSSILFGLISWQNGRRAVKRNLVGTMFQSANAR